MDCGVVVFNYSEWIVQYPEFAGVLAPQAQSYFNRATLFCDNTPTSPIQDLFQRTILLNEATAHVAALFAAANGQGPRPVVGRLAGATEGSVTAQFAYIEPRSDLEAWWNQTPYGASFWAATTQYRAGFYVPPPCGTAGFPGSGRFGFRR